MKVALFRTDSPTHILGWRAENPMGWSTVGPFPDQNPEALRGFTEKLSPTEVPLTPHPLRGLVADESTRPADRSFQTA